MQKYHSHVATKVVPQSQPIPGRNQVPNNAGGYAWQTDDWAQLDRFLILGTEGGTYYVGESKLVKENAEASLRCIQADGQRVARRIVEVSKAGRAHKNDAALYLLAACSALGDVATRHAAFEALPEVARIGTHLFHFAEYRQAFGGWGRAMRHAIQDWYTSQPVMKLAYQAVKYQSRDGWSHRDLLRLAHPKPLPDRAGLFRWIVKGTAEDVPEIVHAFEQAKTASTKEIVHLIQNSNLPREAIPTEKLKEPEIWEALLVGMPLHALIRNLGNMSKAGILKPLSGAARYVVDALSDRDALKKARLHPIAILAAAKTYSQGKGVRGHGQWEVNQAIVDALDDAFYASFESVEPTGKRLLLGVDVSGSMFGHGVSGVAGMTADFAAAAMALITARTEPQHAIVAFDDEIKPLGISHRQRLDGLVRALEQMGHGGTDCALPIDFALKNKIEVDAFVIITDNETWAGWQQPQLALEEYRRKVNPKAKLVWVATAANRVELTDKSDALSMGIAGFDPTVPEVIAEFIR